MKKFLCVLFAATLFLGAFAFVGCKDNGGANQDSGAGNEVYTPFPPEWATEN